MESTQNASTIVVQLAERRSLQLFTTPLKVSWEQVELVWDTPGQSKPHSLLTFTRQLRTGLAGSINFPSHSTFSEEGGSGNKSGFQPLNVHRVFFLVILLLSLYLLLSSASGTKRGFYLSPPDLGTPFSTAKTISSHLLTTCAGCALGLPPYPISKILVPNQAIYGKGFFILFWPENAKWVHPL